MPELKLYGISGLKLAPSPLARHGKWLSDTKLSKDERNLAFAALMAAEWFALENVAVTMPKGITEEMACEQADKWQLVYEAARQKLEAN